MVSNIFFFFFFFFFLMSESPIQKSKELLINTDNSKKSTKSLTEHYNSKKIPILRIFFSSQIYLKAFYLNTAPIPELK